MSDLPLQQLLGSNLRVKARITKVAIVPPGEEGDTEGDPGNVRYSARVTEAPGAFQIAGHVGVDDAKPVGRPTNQAVIEYAKEGDACDLYFKNNGPPDLYVFTEHILFDECEGDVTPVPGTLVVGENVHPLVAHGAVVSADESGGGAA